MRALAGFVRGFLYRFYRGNATFKRMPVFTQFICTYFVIVIIMFSMLLSISARMKDVAIDSYLDQIRLNLKANAASFKSQIENFKSMPFTMDQIEYYSEMRILKELQLRNHYGLLKLQALFRQQCLLMEIPNSSFCLFKRNGSIVTNNQYYIDALDYLGKKVDINDLAIENVMEVSSPVNGLLSSHMISIDNKESSPYLTYMFQPSAESTIYGMLMSEPDILAFFRINEICPNTRLAILYENGDTLYTNWNGVNDDTFTNVECYILHFANKKIVFGIK